MWIKNLIFTVRCPPPPGTTCSYSASACIVHGYLFLLVPDLLFGVHNIPSSTSESVSILVNVDEQTNCDSVEGLTITATLTEGVIDMIVSTEQADFADGIITFRSISAGDYTCSVTVEDETGPVESMPIPCGGTHIDFVPLAINPKAKTLSNKLYLFITDYIVQSFIAPAVLGVSVGVVCSLCFLIIGVLIGVLATIASQKCKRPPTKVKVQQPHPLMCMRRWSLKVARSKFTRKKSFSLRRMQHMDMSNDGY